MNKQSLLSLSVVAVLIFVLTGPALALDYQTTEKNLISNRLICKVTTDNSNPLSIDFSRFKPVSQTNTFASLTESGETDYSSGADYGVLHRYLGYSTLLLAGVAAVTSSNKSVHYGAAYAATGAAVATCATGFVEYGERYDLEEGLLSSDNLHINLGIIGTVAFATAVAIADSGKESSHAGIGITGGTAMLLSVVVIKW